MFTGCLRGINTVCASAVPTLKTRAHEPRFATMYQPVALIASLSPTEFLRIPSHLIPNSVSTTSCSIWLTAKGLGVKVEGSRPSP